MTSPEGRWSPGIGDPTALGWITVAAYAFAFLLCLACVRIEDQEKRARRFWLATTVIMALLGVNKQLDLQTWLTQTGRDLAFDHGWYEQRRIVQIAFIAVLSVAAACALAVLERTLRGIGREAVFVGAGLVVLTAFVLVRAASFHHIDRMLKVSLGSVRVNAILELGGIACIAFGAGMRRWRTGANAGRRAVRTS